MLWVSFESCIMHNTTANIVDNLLGIAIVSSLIQSFLLVPVNQILSPDGVDLYAFSLSFVGSNCSLNRGLVFVQCVNFK